MQKFQEGRPSLAGGVVSGLRKLRGEKDVVDDEVETLGSDFTYLDQYKSGNNGLGEINS